MKKKRVVITGMGAVSCFGSDVRVFYQKLLQGKSGVKTIESFDASSFSTQFAAQVTDFSIEGYMEKKQARRVDPFIRYAFVAAKKALEDAGLSSIKPSKKVGVMIGSGMGGMSAFNDGVLTVNHHGFKRLTPFFVPSIITNMAGGMLAIEYGFSGPNYSISTACATANNSILSAYEAIQLGKADLMLSGGAEAAINPIGMAGFMSMKALSTRNDAPEKASRPWDKSRDGFVMGEGAGVLVLEELERAKKRGANIYAEILGGFTNCDAYHITTPQPEGLVVSDCMDQALQSAHVTKDRVHYINAHATSTPVGDLCEFWAIQNLFRGNEKLYVNSIKSMIGHPLGAAGALEAITTIMTIQNGEIPPTINLESSEAYSSNIDLCADGPKKVDIDVALSNSFGFGGHNASLVFSRYA